MKHTPKLSSYDHVIKMEKRKQAKRKRVPSIPVKTGKYIPAIEDQKHAKAQV